MRQPPALVAAAVLGVAYAIVFIGEAVFLLYEFLGHHGSLGAKQLSGRAAGGVIEVSALLVFAGVLLGRGAVRLLRRGQPALLLAPLVVFILVGIVGETIDLVGSASAVSDAIGAGILLLAALPVLLVVSSARAGDRWTTTGSR